MRSTAELGSTRSNGAGTAAQENFRVAVFAHPDDASELTEVLTSSAGLHRDDALRGARLCPGLLPPHVTEDIAQEIVRQLALRGICSVAVPQAEVPILDDAITVHQLTYDLQGFELLDLHGKPRRTVAWKDLSLLSVGSLPLEDGQHAPAEPQVILHAAPNPYRAIQKSAVREGLILWMVCERPWQVYRFLHTQMGYEHLGARRTPSMSQNFMMFVNDLAQHAPQAYLTPATRTFLHHGLHRHFEFHSTQELRDYTVFHLIAQRKVSQAATSAVVLPTAGATAVQQ